MKPFMFIMSIIFAFLAIGTIFQLIALPQWESATAATRDIEVTQTPQNALTLTDQAKASATPSVTPTNMARTIAVIDDSTNYATKLTGIITDPADGIAGAVVKHYLTCTALMADLLPPKELRYRLYMVDFTPEAAGEPDGATCTNEITTIHKGALVIGMSAETDRGIANLYTRAGAKVFTDKYEFAEIIGIINTLWPAP